MSVKRKNLSEESADSEAKTKKLFKKSHKTSGKESTNETKEQNHRTKIKVFKKSHGSAQGFKAKGKFSKVPNEKSRKIPGPGEKPTEKVDWKIVKTEKKQLLLKRKQKKANYSVSSEIKKLYEIIKKKSIKANEKADVIQKLFNLLKVNIRSFVVAHDTARVVQCLLKKANAEIKKEISELLLPMISEIATSKYAHHCVSKIIKYGDKTIKSKAIENLYGSIYKLTLNQISHHMIDTIFTTYASEMQKVMMKQEFYGEMYRNCKESKIKKLSDVYKDSPEIKKGVLNAVKSNLEQVANKNVVDNSLVHAVLYEYLNECEQTDIEYLISIYSQKIPLLLTTRDGCKAAIFMFWKAQTRDRRAMVKSIKDHIIKICTHEQGYMFLIAIINSMDDTKTMKKQIFDPILGGIDKVMECQWGQKVIEWIVAPACTENFHPKLIEYIDEGLKYGKKPADVRRKEILESIEEPLSNVICSNLSFWMSNGHIGLVTATILKKFSSNYFSSIADGIANLITKCDWTCAVNNESKKHDSDNKDENQDVHPGIEDAGLHVVLKKIIKNDQLRISSNEKSFGEFIVDNLSSDTIFFWITINRACFILLSIIENSNDEIRKKLVSMISERKNELKAQTHKGAELLLKTLSIE